MRTLQLTRALIILWAATSALCAPLASASETNAIEALRFDPVEMHYGDLSKIEVVAGDKLGEMPVPILDESGDGFVKILMPDGNEAWVNRGDVRVGGVSTQAICAKTRLYTHQNDRRSAHLRGIGRDCN